MLAGLAQPRETVCLVTGASSGIGVETARGLARTGATVVVVGRSEERTTSAADDIRRTTGNRRIETLCADFSSLEEVRGLARAFGERHGSLQVLVNNAGLWHPKRSLSRDGFEDTFAVNHLAPFLLTNLLLDRLRRGAPARVVNVSSRLHLKERAMKWDDLQSERRYSGIGAYRQSKLANVLFSNELARRLRGTGVTSNAVHPGDVATDVTRENRLLTWVLKRLAGRVLMTPAEGARTTLHVATDPGLAEVTGAYFSDCKLAKPAPAAEDEGAAGRLWRLSEELTAS